MNTQQGKYKREDWDNPERWRQYIPSPPRIDQEHRHHLAREWLKFLGCEVTEERIGELAPVVMRYHPLSPKGQVANDLVTAGITPYRARVEAEFRVWRKRTFQEAAKQARAFLKGPGNITAVCEFITGYRKRTVMGPLWREVAEELGLPQETVAIMLQTLADRGVVSFSTETRSLDVVTDDATTDADQG